LPQQRTCLIQNRLAHRGDDDTGSISLEQHQPKLSLKRLDAPAECWLRDVKVHGSRGKRAVVGDPDRMTPFVQIHGHLYAFNA
tara:strand:+ start:12219 stop:12467 length:249 start_codon:yes stop_codon:yes gene_type:complete